MACGRLRFHMLRLRAHHCQCMKESRWCRRGRAPCCGSCQCTAHKQGSRCTELLIGICSGAVRGHQAHDVPAGVGLCSRRCQPCQADQLDSCIACEMQRRQHGLPSVADTGVCVCVCVCVCVISHRQEQLKQARPSNARHLDRSRVLAMGSCVCASVWLHVHGAERFNGSMLLIALRARYVLTMPQ